MSNFPRWNKVDWEEVRAGDFVVCKSRTAEIRGIVSKSGLSSFTVDNISILSSFDGTIHVDVDYYKTDSVLPADPGSVIVVYTVEGDEGCWNMMLDDYGMWCSPTPIGDFGTFEFPPSSIHSFDLAEVVIVDAN